jgi:hypothetical protein
MPESDRTRAAHLQILAVSWNFGWPIAAGVGLGYWIDESLGSSPAATLLFGIGALAASTWRLLLLSKREQAARQADELANPRIETPREAPPLEQRWDPETEQWVDDEGSGWENRDSGDGSR